MKAGYGATPPDISGRAGGFGSAGEKVHARADSVGALSNGQFQGTRPSTHNAWGEVTGWYVDTNYVNHGFVWQP